MPRELITIQIGQCGIQLGSRFWDLALKEHAVYTKRPIYDDALSSFFRNVTEGKNPVELGVGNGRGKIRSLKARSILVDMEEGVINQILRSPLGELFDEHQLIRDNSGSGNNWARGHCEYGSKYAENVVESVRRTAETCDSLQSFFLIHSLGGGTGSGLGTYILSKLADESLFIYLENQLVGLSPGALGREVESEWAFILSLNQLIQHADCILPIENQALIDICNRIHSFRDSKDGGGGLGGGGAQKANKSLLSDGTSKKKEKENAFAQMNTIGAHLLCNLTCSMRFEGHLNVDLNEITMNLVPFPKLHLLLSSIAPLATMADKKVSCGVRGMDQMFSQVFSRDSQLTTVNQRASTYLAAGVIVRGRNVQVSDINRNIDRLRPKLKMIPWNTDGFKIGLCSAPPAHQPYSALCLANNCAIRGVVGGLADRFSKLFRVRAHVHHYTEYLELQEMQAAYRRVRQLASDYEALENAVPRVRRRITPVV
eukprot:jgi/Bigna1/37395/e_gw1.19.48.1